MKKLFKEFLEFFWKYRLVWLIIFLMIFAILGVFIILTKNGIIVPFVYVL